MAMDWLYKMFGPGAAATKSYGPLMGGLLDDPAVKNDMLTQGLLGLAGPLLEAAGPSPRRTSIAQALGRGLQASRQGSQGVVDQALRAKMVGLEFDKFGLDKQKTEAEIAALAQTTEGQNLLATNPPASWTNGLTAWRARVLVDPEGAAKMYDPAEWKTFTGQTGSGMDTQNVTMAYDPRDPTRQLEMSRGDAFKPHAPGDLETGSTSALTTRAAKIADQLRLHPTMTEAQAVSIVDGFAQKVTHPTTGETMVVDLATNQATAVPAQYGAGAPPPTEGAADPSLPAAAEGATGIPAGAARMYAWLAGSLPGQQAPDTMTAVRELNTFNNTVTGAFMQNPKFAEGERKNILDMLPKPSTFGDPSQAAADVNRFYSFLQQQERALLSQEAQPGLDPQNRQDVQAKRLTVQRVLSLMQGWSPNGGGSTGAVEYEYDENGNPL